MGVITRSAVACILAIVLLGLPAACQTTPDPDAGPGLVLLLAVDQLRRDRVHADLPGGLGRLAREGRFFVDASLAHADTTTCPGHATMLTGRHPGPAGIPSNAFIDRETLRVVYCVDDPGEDASVIGGELGRSPRKLRVTALGDWMKAARPETRVFAISGKDRAAVTLGGQRPDAAYWFDWDRGHFTTSHYYLDELPRWIRDWRSMPIPSEWEHASGDPPNGARRDDYPAEDPDYSRTSPHPVQFLHELYVSPFADQMTLEFALALVTRERLGRGDGPDLLAVSLSATDTIGHLYGPGSQEARDALLRLDRALGSFLDQLEQRVGRGRVLVALTSDHGVLPLPEWWQEQGKGACPFAGGRASLSTLSSGLSERLADHFGPPPPDQQWVVHFYNQFRLNRRLVGARDVDPDAVLALAHAHLATQPGVAAVWRASEVAAGSGDEPFARLYRNSHDPERSPDLLIQPVSGCLFSPYEHGTSHGSPYPYDRDVPLIFFGTGVEPGRIPGPAATVDIAPTLAAALAISTPSELDGRALPLVER